MSIKLRNEIPPTHPMYGTLALRVLEDGILPVRVREPEEIKEQLDGNV